LGSETSRIVVEAFQILKNKCFVELVCLQIENEWFEESCVDQEFFSSHIGKSIQAFLSLGYSSDGKTVNLYQGCLSGIIGLSNTTSDLSSIWEDFFFPDGFKSSLTEMSSFRFIVGIRSTPYLEMASIIRGHNCEGIFESHITISNGPGVEAIFQTQCKETDCKCVMIQLPTGVTHEQLMSSRYHRGSFLSVEKEVFSLAATFAKAGLKITRAKIEAMFSNTGVPQSNQEALCLSPENYFEFHLKVAVEEKSLKQLQEICSQYSAHLSKNAFKLLSDGKTLHFVTQRIWTTGAIDAFHTFSKLKEFIEENGFITMGLMREYSLYDSNIKLDSGWIDKPAVVIY